MKKLFLLIPLFALLILTGCGQKNEVIQHPTTPVVVNKPVEQLPIPSDDEANEQEPDETIDKNDDHSDGATLFAGGNFSSDKEQNIEGYDIVIKHKDDIHAGDKITWTITVTQGGSKINGFEKIDGDDGVGIVKDPTEHLEHLHPLAFTDNTLTFSSHSHDVGTYEIITQFKHNGNIITIPYKIDLLTNEEGHGHE